MVALPIGFMIKVQEIIIPIVRNKMSKFLGLKKLTKEDFKLSDEIVIGGEVYVKKQRPLSPQVIGDLLEPYGDFNSYDYKQGFVDGVLCAEKAHGITGVDDE